MYESPSFKQGFCDGLFNRKSDSQSETFHEQNSYLIGYLRGKDAGKGVLSRKEISE